MCNLTGVRPEVVRPTLCVAASLGFGVRRLVNWRSPKDSSRPIPDIEPEVQARLKPAEQKGASGSQRGRSLRKAGVLWLIEEQESLVELGNGREAFPVEHPNDMRVKRHRIFIAERTQRAVHVDRGQAHHVA